MSSKRQAMILLLILTIFSFTIKPSSSDWITIYWGQNTEEGTLKAACDTGLYEIVLLGFLDVFGEGRTPSLNFTGHCGGSSCTQLESEINHCQNNFIEVYLSIGGPSGTYSLGSSDDAKNFADYLYTNFLTLPSQKKKKNQVGPLGEVTLSGINFNIEAGTNLYWDDLVMHLDNYRETETWYFFLAATPQCSIPDYYLDKAIKTGLFNYIFVKFYNNPSCQYDQTNVDATPLLQSWDAWVSSVPPELSIVFWGLPASPDAAPGGGYIPANDLISKVLPHIEETCYTHSCGGFMLWDRFHDVGNNYSNQVKHWDEQSARRFVTQVSKARIRSVSAV